MFYEETKELTSVYSEQIENLLEVAAREKCVPLLKGNVTKGKIRWRGLRHVVKDCGFIGNSHIVHHWASQRGKRISPVLSVELNSDGKRIYMTFKLFEPLNEEGHCK